jgi:hypothetical protein
MRRMTKLCGPPRYAMPLATGKRAHSSKVSIGVVHANWNRGAGRRLSNPLLPFAPRWRLRAMHRSLGEIAAMPAAGHIQSFNQAA